MTRARFWRVTIWAFVHAAYMCRLRRVNHADIDCTMTGTVRNQGFFLRQRRTEDVRCGNYRQASHCSRGTLPSQQSVPFSCSSTVFMSGTG